MSGMSLEGLANTFDAWINEKENVRPLCTFGKLGCVVAAVSIAVLSVFTILSGTFLGVACGLVIGGGCLALIHDVFVVCDNKLKLSDGTVGAAMNTAKNKGKEFFTGKNESSKNLLKGTFILQLFG